MLKHRTRQVLHRAGIEAQRYSSANFAHLRLREVLRSGEVDVLVDGGANDGRWAAQRRAEGFRGKIVSFEPQSTSFAELERRAAGDVDWVVYHAALGASDGHAVLNVDRDPTSSSLAGGRRDGQPVEEVRLVALDSVVRGQVIAPDDRVFMKLDVEGFELEALHGGPELLKQTSGLMVELATRPASGAAPLEDVVAALRAARFFLVAFEPNMRDRQGNLRLANGLFLRDAQSV